MGPSSPETELARLRVAGSGHHSLFKEVKGRLPLWEHHRRQTPERKHTNQHTHTQPLSEFTRHAGLDEDGAGVTV